MTTIAAVRDDVRWGGRAISAHECGSKRAHVARARPKMVRAFRKYDADDDALATAAGTSAIAELVKAHLGGQNGGMYGMQGMDHGMMGNDCQCIATSADQDLRPVGGGDMIRDQQARALTGYAMT